MSRNTYLAKLINKLYRAWWFITRPSTKGVKALVFNHKNEVLMIRLSYYPNTWTFPGGGVDAGEKPQTAARREVREEVGIKLGEIDFVTTLDFKHEHKKDTVFVYQATVENVKVEIDKKEVAEAGWFSLEELPPMGSNAKRILESVK